MFNKEQLRYLLDSSENINFENRYFRNDIGSKALKAGEEN